MHHSIGPLCVPFNWPLRHDHSNASEYMHISNTSMYVYRINRKCMRNIKQTAPFVLYAQIFFLLPLSLSFSLFITQVNMFKTGECNLSDVLFLKYKCKQVEKRVNNQLFMNSYSIGFARNFCCCVFFASM